MTSTWHGESWKVETIRRQAQGLGFPVVDIGDVTQEVILKMRSFTYDPSKSNGGSERKVFAHFVNRKLRQILRKRFAYRQRIEKKKRLSKTFHDKDDSRQLEVSEIIKGLTAFEKKVCELLKDGNSQREIAETLNVGRSEVKKIVLKLQMIFKDFK